MNGKCLRQGAHIGELTGPDFIDVLMDLFVDDGMLEKEHLEVRDKARAQTMNIMRGHMNSGYDSTEEYGRSNDDFGSPLESGPPMPFIPATEQDDNGYIGLLPPSDA